MGLLHNKLQVTHFLAKFSLSEDILIDTRCMCAIGILATHKGSRGFNKRSDGEIGWQYAQHPCRLRTSLALGDERNVRMCHHILSIWKKEGKRTEGHDVTRLSSIAHNTQRINCHVLQLMEIGREFSQNFMGKSLKHQCHLSARYNLYTHKEWKPLKMMSLPPTGWHACQRPCKT